MARLPGAVYCAGARSPRKIGGFVCGMGRGRGSYGRASGSRNTMKAILALDRWRNLRGRELRSCLGTTSGEVVFNTGMTGYQEVLTDPSYAGQLVTLTYPLIGNYGINLKTILSRGKVQVAGFVVRELADVYSNWRATMSRCRIISRKRESSASPGSTRALSPAASAMKAS